LPKPPIEEDEEEEDPREELVRRLLEYQKYRDAAERLSNEKMLFRDLFPRGVIESFDLDDEEAPLKEIGLFELVEAFKQALANVQDEEIHEVTMERLSISERIGQIADILATKKGLTFKKLFSGKVERSDIIITFLALLEMVRLRIVRTFQAQVDGEIYLTPSPTDGPLEDKNLNIKAEAEPFSPEADQPKDSDHET